MRLTRRTSYAAAIALAAATLTACGSSASDGSTPAGPPSVTSSPAPAGNGDLQLRQASSAQKPPTKPCTSAPVAPATPTYRCDRDGTGYQLGPAFVTGAMVSDAEAQQTESGPVVQVKLDAAGTKALAAATTKMVPLGPPEGLLGIMSGGRLYGAPLVQSPVLDGVFIIGGLANMADAVSLAASIRG